VGVISRCYTVWLRLSDHRCTEDLHRMRSYGEETKFNKVNFLTIGKMVFAFVLDEVSYQFYSIADWWIQFFLDFWWVKIIFTLVWIKWTLNFKKHKLMWSLVVFLYFSWIKYYFNTVEIRNWVFLCLENDEHQNLSGKHFIFNLEKKYSFLMQISAAQSWIWQQDSQNH